MEEKELLEIEARETEQAKKNVKEMIQRRKIGDIWHLYQDRFDLRKKSACYVASPEVSLPTLIPIYEKVVFPVLPYSSPEQFEHERGFSLRELPKWRNRGWIETVLALPPRRYTGLDYLDDLIRVSPSRSTRIEAYISMLLGDMRKFDNLLAIGKTFFREAPEYIHDRYGEAHGREIHTDTLAAHYVNLSAFGLTQITESVEELSRNEPEVAQQLLFFAGAFLCSPFLHGLRGTTVYPSRAEQLAKAFYESLRPRGEVLFAPCWLADVYTNLGATIPQTMDIDEIGAVRKHSEDFVRAVKSLDEEIDKAVREKFGGGELNRGEKETILAKKEEFRKRWFEDVVPTFEDISRVKKAWSMTLTGSIVTSVVALVALKDILTVPSTMLGALLNRGKIEKLVDPAAEFLSTFFECNPIHLGFYKVHREFKKVKHRAG